MKIIKFTALWCADCIAMRPMWSEVREKYPDLEIVEYDFDDHSEMVENHRIKKVPHMIIYDDNGEEVLSLEGLLSKQELLSAIEEYLKLKYE